MVLILKRFFDQIPIELEDAARVDGANRLRVFWSIVLPMSRPILAAVATFAYGLQYAQNMAAAILAALPLVMVFLFFQRQIIKGIATTGFDGQ